MRKFKKGNKIRLIAPSNWGLMQGEIYTFKKYYKDYFLRVEEKPELIFGVGEFELVEAKPEVIEKTMDNLVKGDKIQRINDDFGNVIVGQVYTFDRYLYHEFLLTGLLIEGDPQGYSLVNFIPYKDSVKEFEEKEWLWDEKMDTHKQKLRDIFETPEESTLDETIDHDPFTPNEKLREAAEAYLGTFDSPYIFDQEALKKRLDELNKQAQKERYDLFEGKITCMTADEIVEEFRKNAYKLDSEPAAKDVEYMKNLPKEWITGAFIGQSNSGAFTATSEPKEVYQGNIDEMVEEFKKNCDKLDSEPINVPQSWSKELEKAQEEFVKNKYSKEGSVESFVYDELNKKEATKHDSGKPREFESGMKRDSDDSKPYVHNLQGYTRLRFGYLTRMGANRYGDGNFLKGSPSEDALKSLDRHLARFMDGDRTEDHLAAIIFNVQLIMLNEKREGVPANHYFKI